MERKVKRKLRLMKKISCMLLCVCMAVTPMSVWADDETTTVQIATTTLTDGMFYVSAVGIVNETPAEQRIVDEVTVAPMDGNYLSYSSETKTLTVHGQVELLNGSSSPVLCIGSGINLTMTGEANSKLIVKSVSKSNACLFTGNMVLEGNVSLEASLINSIVNSYGALTTGTNYMGDIILTSNNLVFNESPCNLTTKGNIVINMPSQVNAPAVSTKKNVVLNGKNVSVISNDENAVLLFSNPSTVTINATDGDVLLRNLRCAYNTSTMNVTASKNKYLLYNTGGSVTLSGTENNTTYAYGGDYSSKMLDLSNISTLTAYTAGDGYIFVTPAVEGDNPTPNTLTLMNANIETSENNALEVPVDTVIVVEGESNTLKGANNGIYSTGKLDIKGTGTLIANGGAYGINVSGDLTVSDTASVTGNGGNTTNGSSYGVNVSNLTVESGASVTGTSGTATGSGTWDGYSYGIRASGRLTSAGTVDGTADDAEENSCGIYVGQIVNVNGGSITATGKKSTAANSYGLRIYNGDKAADALNVTGGAITATSGAAKGEFSKDSEKGISAGIYVYKGNINTAAGTTVSGISSTTETPETREADSNAYKSYGIYLENGNLNTSGEVIGKGSVADEESKGIQVNKTDPNTTVAGNLTAEEGAVLRGIGGEAKYSYGIYVRGAVVETAGKVTGIGSDAKKQSSGVIVSLDITVNNSELTGIGGKVDGDVEETDNKTYLLSEGISTSGYGGLQVTNSTVKGKGGATTIGSSYGIRTSSFDGMTVNSGSVEGIGDEANLESCGIKVVGSDSNSEYGKLTFNGGTTTAKTTATNTTTKVAICANASINFNNGTEIKSPTGTKLGTYTDFQSENYKVILNSDGTPATSVTIGPKSTGGGGGGSSTTTTTTTNPDGSTTTKVTNSATGTVTETTKGTDGSTTVTETKKDGTVTETAKDAAGNSTVTEKKPDGTVTETVKDAAGNTTETIKNTDGSVQITDKKADGLTTVTNTDTNGKTTAQVTVPTASADADVKVNIPVKLGSTNGTVSVKITYPDGKTETVKCEYSGSNASSGNNSGAGSAGALSSSFGTVNVSVAGSASIEILDDFVPLAAAGLLPFADVNADDYFYDAVQWAVSKGITSGMSNTIFAPKETCTRAQTVTFLWRAMGSPEPKTSDNPFTDVSADAYYYKAVMWAVENGITTGTGPASFEPNAAVSRGQTATFLWRTAGEPVVNYAMAFSDVDESAYYGEAVRWAVAEGITNGTDTSTFSPADGCTRAQIVTFLYRYCSK